MKKHILSILMALVLMLPIIAGTISRADAAQTVSMNVQGTYNYTEAYKVLEKVNKERKARGIPALKMDETLLKCAMKRAVEIHLVYDRDHRRPNGSNCFSILPYPYNNGCGENIAIAYANAADVMKGWMSSTGHRNTILKSGFKSVGIGCFTQANGQPTWVQIFSYASPKEVKKSGQVNTTTSVKALTSNLSLTPVSCQVYKGNSIKLELRNNNVQKNGMYTTIRPTWSSTTSKATSIATASNGSAVGKAAGKTTIVGTVGGKTFNIAVTVKELSKPAISSVSNTKNGIYLKWGKISGATGYVIQRKVGSDGTWQSVKTISSGSTVSWTDTGRANGTVYYYRIYATNGSSKSKVSDSAKIKMLTVPATPVVKSDTAGDIAISWNKNSKCSGYQVKYVANDVAKTKKVSGSGTISTTLAQMPSNTTYQVYVRTYSVVGDTTYYSAYSNVASVRVK